MFSVRAWAWSLGLLAWLSASGSGNKAHAQSPDAGQTPKADVPEPSAEGRIGMTPAIVCGSIAGYEQYVPLPAPVLSPDDKLLVYYRPLRYAVVPVGPKYQVHFVQDARMRKRGEKTAVWSKDKLVEFKPESPDPPSSLYMFNRISLKGMTPGDYDLDIILHDVNGKNATVEQTLRFKVKPSLAPPKSEPKGEGKAAEDAAPKH